VTATAVDRPTRVLVVDDQALVRGGFTMILESEPDITVVGEAADGVEAVRVVAEQSPDVVVMDVRMPRMDGIEATRRITASGRARVLVLTTFDLDESSTTRSWPGPAASCRRTCGPGTSRTRRGRSRQETASSRRR
jgi:DNA-binding NarL/FixJ family response regulator